MSEDRDMGPHSTMAPIGSRNSASGHFPSQRLLKAFADFEFPNDHSAHQYFARRGRHDSSLSLSEGNSASHKLSWLLTLVGWGTMVVHNHAQHD